jgi:tetratricopeptide (TPR) repeat protein
MARQGAFTSGAHSLETALANLGGTENSAYAWENPNLALAEAALELQQWNVAAPLYQQAARSLPAEPFTQLSLARAMVKAAEIQQTCGLLKATAHAPGEDVLSEAAYQQFDKAIQAASQLSTSTEIARWARRGQAIFHPNLQSVHALHELADNPDDAAALVLDLHRIGDQKIIPEIAARHAGHPAVTFQSAVHFLDNAEANNLAALQAIAEKQPGHPHVLALLAMEANKEGDPATAYRAMTSALAAWPDEPYWHAVAAEAASKCRDTSGSLEHWKKAADLDPENIVFTQAFGDALLAAGQVDQAIQTLEMACASDSGRVDAWLSLANAYRTAGDYRHAIGGAEKAIYLAPGQVKPILMSGEIALEAGQIELGLQRAKTALQMDPKSPKATWLLARSQTLSGHPGEALNTIETALPLLSDPYEVLVERTRLIRQVKGAQSALEALKDLVGEYPEEPEGLGDYAKALSEAGQRDAAEKAAQSALLLQPDRPDIHLLLGRIQHATGQLDQAIHHLSEAIRLAPNDIEAYLELGKVHQDRREHNLAQKVYQQASAVAPSDARPYYQAGLTLKEGKDYISAEIMLRKAAELAPEDLNIRRQLAAIIAINLVHNPQEASLPR